MHAHRFRTMDLPQIEEVNPYYIPPWRGRATVKIYEREEPSERAIISLMDHDIQPILLDEIGIVQPDSLATQPLGSTDLQNRTTQLV